MKIINKKLNFDMKTVGLGVLIAMLFSWVMICGEAWLVLKGNLSPSLVKYVSLMIYFLSLTFGALVVRVIKHQLAATTMMMICAVYSLFVLVVNLLIYSEGVYNVQNLLIGVVCAFIISIIQNRQQGRGKRYHKKIRIR